MPELEQANDFAAAGAGSTGRGRCGVASRANSIWRPRAGPHILRPRKIPSDPVRSIRGFRLCRRQACFGCRPTDSTTTNEPCRPRPVAQTRLPTMNRKLLDQQVATPCRGVIWIALVVACCAGGGCVHRRFTVRTNPPGARVFVDGYEIGTSPCSHDFVYYGTRQIRLVKDGYETLTILQPIPTPWWDLPGIDFVSENLIPNEIHDRRVLDFQMQPQLIVPTEQLMSRAEELRRSRNPNVPAGAVLPQGAAGQGSFPESTLPPPGTMPPPGTGPSAMPPGNIPPGTFPSGTYPPSNVAPPGAAAPGGGRRAILVRWFPRCRRPAWRRLARRRRTISRAITSRRATRTLARAGCRHQAVAI